MKLIVQNLWKKFDQNIAVKNVSFKLASGSITGFLGANGAGKSTIIRSILGLLHHSGQIFTEAFEDGEAPQKITENSSALRKAESNELNPSVGAVLDKTSFVGYLTGWENLIAFGRINDQPKTSDTKQNINGVKQIAALRAIKSESQTSIEAKVKKALERTNLLDVAAKKVSTYSTGMLKRLAIALSILHSPDFLILDEPFEGLDPESRFLLRKIVRQFADEGKAVFISSHQLSELEELCTNVIFLRKGSIIFNGKIKDLSSGISNKITFTTGKEDECRIILCDAFPELANSCNKTGSGFTVQAPYETIPAIVTRLIEAKIPVFEVVREKESLEHLYLSRAGYPQECLPVQTEETDNKELKKDCHEIPDNTKEIPDNIKFQKNLNFISTKTSLWQTYRYEFLKLRKNPWKVALLFLPSLLPIMLIPLLLLSPYIFAGFRAKYILPAISGCFTLSLSFGRYIYPLLCAIIAADSFATESGNGIIDTGLSTGLSRIKLFAAKSLVAISWLFLSLSLFPILYTADIFIAWVFMDKSWWKAYNLPLESIAASSFLLLIFYFLAQITIFFYWTLFAVQSEGFGKTIAKGLIPITALATIGSLSNEICTIMALKMNPAFTFFTVQYAKIGDFDLLDSVYNHGIAAWPPFFLRDIYLLSIQGLTFCALAALLFSRRDFNGGRN
jgi:ABC-2 type transport system ATP-binding protein